MNLYGIYVHVPWCRRRCPYCDFFFVVGKPKPTFIQGLKEEFLARRDQYPQTLATSLYFGGGTPSLLPLDQVDEFVDFLRLENALSDQAEVTLEGNPEDFDASACERLPQSKVTRVSLGVQSFCDATLKFLGRKHTAAAAWELIQSMITVEINLSVDIIIGVPGESIDEILAQLTRLEAMGVKHISAYLLTIEEKTNFFRQIKMGTRPEPAEESQVACYNAVQAHLAKLGYCQYDISSFAKPGFFSRHNQLYWAQGEFLGLGPGAHSMKMMSEGGIMRLHNQATVSKWLQQPVDEQYYALDQLTKEAALRESLAFGLRNMATGITPAVLSARHSTEVPATFWSAVEKFKDSGWLNQNAQTISLTAAGALFADKIMAEILAV
jgi:oxygen-independent coproporphyrinogen-3 oxidase